MRKDPSELVINRSVSMPRYLWQAAKEHAKRDDRSVSKLVTLAVRAYLERAQQHVGV